MVGPTNTQTRLVGIITDEVHPHTFFIETPLLAGMHLVCIIPTNLVAYFLALPSLLISSIYLSPFYSCMYSNTTKIINNMHPHSEYAIKIGCVYPLSEDQLLKPLAGCQSNCLQEAQGHAVLAGLGPRLVDKIGYQTSRPILPQPLRGRLLC